MSNLSALGKLDFNVLHHSIFLKAKMLPYRSFEGAVKKITPAEVRGGDAVGSGFGMGHVQF